MSLTRGPVMPGAPILPSTPLMPCKIFIFRDKNNENRTPFFVITTGLQEVTLGPGTPSCPFGPGGPGKPFIEEQQVG